MISVNGMLTKQASQFSLQDVEVIVGIIDLNEIRRYRQGSNSLQHQISESNEKSEISSVEINFSLCDIKLITMKADGLIQPTIPDPEEECVFGPACWLWDYCRRSGMAGFLLPLSGGADSATVCAIIYTMCRLVIHECNLGNQQVIDDLKIILNKCGVSLEKIDSVSVSVNTDLIKRFRLASDYRGIITKDDLVFRNITSKGLCNLMLHTVYMGTDHSSTQTKGFAETLANSVGSFHSYKNIQKMVDTTRIEFEDLSRDKDIQLKPKFQSFGGSYTEDLALQNIQARTRMVMAYMCAQLFPQARGFKGGLLVLGSANVDESLRGYFTKYDCSSADLNPIGSISKKDLKRTLHWYAESFGIDILRSIVIAPPTAELRPILADSKDTYTQKDEDEMGMTYDELSVFGLLRKQKRCGPVSMFLELLNEWVHLSPVEIAVKVKRFFFYYSINRHKMTTLTPSYHAESYSPDDNRFDLRPFLYNAKWSRQFDKIDLIVIELTIMNKKITELKLGFENKLPDV
jgi:NAD+ synthase (glutamine-hydrolysing)